jgi:hypothetical protein
MPTKKMKKESSSAILTHNSTFTGEKLRGAVTSSVTGSLAVAMYTLGVASMGLSAPVSAFLFLYLSGAALGYSADIIFAKRSFVIRGVPVELPYGDLGRRFRWLARSVLKRYFLRFVIVIVIETLTGLAMLDALIHSMDRHRVLLEHRQLRDAAAAVSVAVVNFLLFGNVLRFDWAYQEVEHPVMNMVVLVWLGFAMMAFAIYKSILTAPTNEAERKEDERSMMLAVI